MYIAPPRWRGLVTASLLAGAGLLLGRPAVAATLTVTSTADAGAGSLRQAVLDANNEVTFPGADTIIFDASLFGTTPQTITLTSGQLSIGTDVTIQGPGAGLLSVSGGNASRVLEVTAGTSALSGLTLTGGNSGASNGGGLLVDAGATLSVADSTITGNAATLAQGGGVFSRGALTLTRSAVTGNTGGQGGGIGSSGGTVALVNVTVADNHGGVSGGGGLDIYGGAQASLINSTVTGNTSGGNAGGIYNEGGGALTLQATIVAGNTAAGAAVDILNSGAFVDGDSNLIGNDTGGPVFTGLHDLVGTALSPLDPGLDLGGLLTLGGTTPTIALALGSPALDADFSVAPPATDQRGVVRPQGARADIGAFEVVILDSTAPTTTASLAAPSYVNGYFRGPVTVTLSASDPSGVSGTYYRVDSGPQRTYAGPFTVTGDFAHLVTFYSIDGAGNAEGPAKSVTFSIDTTAPATEITSRDVPAGREVTLTNRDNFSGPGGTFYRVDSGPQQTYSGPFVVTGNYSHLVTAYSIDRAANAENPAKSLAFTLSPPPASAPTMTADTTAPVTAASLSGPSSGGFSAGPATVTLTATDDRSGVSGTFYRVDSGPQQTYTGPFHVSGDFTHLVTFYSIDGAGNAEGPAKSLTFTVDSAAPVTTGAVQAVSGGRQVTLTASDRGSGVSGTFYRVDSGELRAYTGPFVVTGAYDHLVTFYSIDNVGNAEGPAKSLTFTTNP